MVEESKNYMQDIIDYIKKNTKRGYSKESLKWALVNQGYSKMEVEKAFRMVDQEPIMETTIIKKQPEVRYEPEVLEHEERPLWKRFLGIN